MILMRKATLDLTITEIKDMTRFGDKFDYGV